MVLRITCQQMPPTISIHPPTLSTTSLSSISFPFVICRLKMMNRRRRPQRQQRPRQRRRLKRHQILMNPSHSSSPTPPIPRSDAMTGTITMVSQPSKRRRQSIILVPLPTMRSCQATIGYHPISIRYIIHRRLKRSQWCSEDTGVISTRASKQCSIGESMCWVGVELKCQSFGKHNEG